jgi:hypothetical protein
MPGIKARYRIDLVDSDMFNLFTRLERYLRL